MNELSRVFFGLMFIVLLYIAYLFVVEQISVMREAKREDRLRLYRAAEKAGQRRVENEKS